MSAYVDSSFLASLYLPEINSQKASQRLDQIAEPPLISSLCELEVVNAFQLRVFRKEIHAAQARAAEIAFRSDLSNGMFTLHPLVDDVFQHAIQLALRYTANLGVRSLDILHVAAALALRSQRFETFDERQKQLAKAAGLTAL